MTLREFFNGRALVFAILIIGLFAAWIYKTYFVSSVPSEVSQSSSQENSISADSVVFTWKYEKAESLNLDGISNTNIFLEATYSGGKIERKLIDTVSSSCNDLPDSEKDSVSGSTTIQCYGAGLGYRFKIIQGEKSYLVQRKQFEEGTPAYNPPVQAYETIAEFPL